MQGDNSIRLVMPFPPERPNVDVSMSVAAFVKMVDAMNRQDGVYPDHLFPDPLDIADDPGDIYFRGKKWEVECPLTLEMRKLIADVAKQQWELLGLSGFVLAVRNFTHGEHIMFFRGASTIPGILLTMQGDER
ncbi:hypothetical protein CYMTET_16095 [Cymbomonas tetramitiformis]|uniref:Uncharacterized protein n=1 Tax=Cymbomonas tetramitiformis TaxID=36881 RepID=A0AAE0GCT2_9CHLO|nr:hypothetical protein CYMTET_16095 [Cymbomonas tetramitiformis]